MLFVLSQEKTVLSSPLAFKKKSSGEERKGLRAVTGLGACNPFFVADLLLLRETYIIGQQKSRLPQNLLYSYHEWLESVREKKASGLYDETTPL